MSRLSSGHIESKRVQEILNRYYNRDAVNVAYEAETQKYWDDGDNVYKIYWTNMENEYEIYSITVVDYALLLIIRSKNKKIEIELNKSAYHITKKQMAEIIVKNYEKLH